MTKRIKRFRRSTGAAIDAEFIDCCPSAKPASAAKAAPFRVSLKNLKLRETKKSAAYKKKNSPDAAKINKLRRKITFNSKMALDSDPSEVSSANSQERKELDIWDDAIYPSDKKRPKLKNINQIIPPVELPHPGQSYNPAPEDYTALLHETASKIEQQKSKDAKKGVLETDEMIAKHFPALNTSQLDAKQKQMIVSLISRNITDPDEVEKIVNGEAQPDADDEPADEPMAAPAPQKRKTKTQRNKLRIIKEEKRKRMAERSIKKMKNDVNHIKKLSAAPRRNRSEERLARFKRFLGKLVAGEVPTKISNKTFYPDPPEAALPEELRPSVKSIESASDNPIRRVFASIYRRGLLPAPSATNLRHRRPLRGLKARSHKYVRKPVLSA